jgi:hypothetical protein
LIASFNSVSVSSVSAETACELDSHADTSVAGSNFILLEEPTRTVDVFGFSPELLLIKKVPIATAGTAWVDPKSGQSYLLILNECLFMGNTMKHSLLNPNQLHCNGLTVHDTSTMFDPASTIRFMTLILVSEFHLTLIMLFLTFPLMHQHWKKPI